MISLVQVDYILAIYEERNFQRAADKCFVTQPTLSIQLKKAERQLGGRLFDRDTTPLEPTPFFTKLLPFFLQLQHDRHQLEQRVKRDTEGAKELLRIGVIPTIAHYLIPDMFGELSQAFPKFELLFEEYRTSDLLDRLDRRKVDIAILSGPLDPGNFELQKLYIEEIAVYVNGSHDLKTTSDLQEAQPWLLAEGNCLRSQMVNFCDLSRDNGAKWNYQGSSIDVLTRMVDRYGGYTLIPEHYPTEHLNQSRIIRFSDAHPARSVIACYHKRNVNFPVYKQVFSHIQHRYAKTDNKNWELLQWA
jgi:LysR family transcriptional regulator, hydrogen peroxide-inducible genes activator